MRHILFVRHGQSHSNVGGVTMDNARIPLTDLGHKQAAALAMLLPPVVDRVLVSPFDRTRDTAAPYCRHTRQQPAMLDALREFELIDPVLLQGMTGEQRRPVADAYWSRANPHERMGDHAETFAEFQARITAVRQDMAFWPATTSVFGHRMWLAMLVWQILGFERCDSAAMRSFRQFHLGLPIPNAAVYHLRQAPRQPWTVQFDAAIQHALRELLEGDAVP